VDEKKNHPSGKEGRKMLSKASTNPITSPRPRMSKAERRRLKKDPKTMRSAVTKNNEHDEKRKKNMRGRDFRDTVYFIENDTTSNSEEAQRQRQVEAAMQPSAANSTKGIVGNALRLEEAMLDVVGDENEQLVQKQRMMRWDRSKRKYIQTTVGAELRSGQSYSKRIKLESGQVVKSDKLKLGEIYEKWQKKTNRSVGRNGVFDSVEEGDTAYIEKGQRGKKGKNKNECDGLKSAKSIKSDRDRSQDIKLKNMNKSDRSRLERSSKKDRSNSLKTLPRKGSQGKKGMSGRWKK